MRFIKDIRERFTRLNQNQRIILLATTFLIVLNFIILILSIDIIFRVLEKIG
jgi:flagellar biosynthesis/type III secretory pathway M-ring protein FliF/YscJ